MSPTRHDLERLLRAARPTPRAGFVAELERSLLPRRRQRVAAPRLRVALAGVAFAAILGALAIAMSVAGLLPFSSGHGAQAQQHCQRVVVERKVRVPDFVTDGHGNVTVHYHRQLEPRTVTRCR